MKRLVQKARKTYKLKVSLTLIWNVYYPHWIRITTYRTTLTSTLGNEGGTCNSPSITNRYITDSTHAQLPAESFDEASPRSLIEYPIWDIRKNWTTKSKVKKVSCSRNCHIWLSLYCLLRCFFFRSLPCTAQRQEAGTKNPIYITCLSHFHNKCFMSFLFATRNLIFFLSSSTFDARNEANKRFRGRPGVS